jgi:hypothetical protein
VEERKSIAPDGTPGAEIPASNEETSSGEVSGNVP